MKRTVFILCLILIGASASAQAPVITYSPLEYAQMLKELAQTVKQYEAQIRELQYMYQSVQNQIKMIQNADLRDLKSTLKFLNNQADFALYTEQKLKKMGVKINGESYKLWEINKISDEYQMEMNRIAEEGLSQQEENEVLRWLGIGSALQELLQRTGNYVSDVGKELDTMNEDVKEHQKANIEQWENLIESYKDNQSVVANIQGVMFGMSQLSANLALMQTELVKIGFGISAQSKILEGDLLHLSEQDIVGRYKSFSDEYLKYLKDKK